MSSFSLTCFCVVTLYSRIYTCQMLGKCYSDFSKLSLLYLYLPDVVEVLQWLLKSIVSLFIPACQMLGKCSSDFSKLLLLYLYLPDAGEVLQWLLKAIVTLFIPARCWGSAPVTSQSLCRRRRCWCCHLAAGSSCRTEAEQSGSDVISFLHSN